MRETDLIRKGCNALMRTLDNNDCGLEEEDDENMDLAEMDVDNGEEVDDDDIIESKLIGSPLFCVHLEKLYNQGMVECLAEKSVRIRRELHPSIISFIHQKEVNEEMSLFGESTIFIFTEYKRNGTT